MSPYHWLTPMLRKFNLFLMKTLCVCPCNSTVLYLYNLQIVFVVQEKEPSKLTEIIGSLIVHSKEYLCAYKNGTVSARIKSDYLRGYTGIKVFLLSMSVLPTGIFAMIHSRIPSRILFHSCSC